MVLPSSFAFLLLISLLKSCFWGVESLAGELFALIVYLADGYLGLPQVVDQVGTRRFYRIASELPMDLQMVLSNRTYGVSGSVVKKKYSERGFIKFAIDS